ncbi:CDC42 small effector protein 1-B-like isoform X2 [Carcharodon carcharias]|uniref:CDC42 small effector protein 1-B-like isoform X2 n=1 Tax=Carcharodon carcharias TaxID=13397 RepID=UPI001B7E5F8F|nr:CDC42 small effector protein 1-B-like isoform X2 [Carcharodon carcharias]
MSDFWLCFGCSEVEKAQPKRKRIDRSMIGEPMNFVHLTHVGSGDMSSQGFSMPGSVQERMKSKSGLVTNSTTDTRQTVAKSQLSSQ